MNILAELGFLMKCGMIPRSEEEKLSEIVKKYQPESPDLYEFYLFSSLTTKQLLVSGRYDNDFPFPRDWKAHTSHDRDKSLLMRLVSFKEIIGSGERGWRGAEAYELMCFAFQYPNVVEGFEIRSFTPIFKGGKIIAIGNIGSWNRAVGLRHFNKNFEKSNVRFAMVKTGFI